MQKIPWQVLKLDSVYYHSCQMAEKFCKINQKGLQKIAVGWGILVAKWPPIFSNSGRKGAQKYCFLIFSFSRVSLNITHFLCVVNSVSLWNISFPNPFKNLYCTRTLNFSVFCWIFSQIGQETKLRPSNNVIITPEKRKWDSTVSVKSKIQFITPAKMRFPG